VQPSRYDDVGYGWPVLFAPVRARLNSVGPVGVGLVLLGISAYAVLGLAGHALKPRDYAAVASLYLLIAILGPGLFIAVEQETNRQVSSRLAAGIGTLPVARSAAVLSAILAAAVVAVVLVLSPVLLDRVFGGSWSLVIATIVAVIGAAAVYLWRGMFAGQRRYGWYAATLGAEGLGRLIPCLALGVLSLASISGFGYAFAFGALLAAAMTLPGVRLGEPGPAAPLGRMARGVGLIAGASGLLLLVANLAPVVLTSRLTEDPETAASFVSLFVLARLPFFFLGSMHAFLLPALTAAANRGDPARLRSHLRIALGIVLALGLVAALGVALLGPWAARVFFDAPVDLSPLIAGLLGISTAALLVTQVLQSALLALDAYRTATTAWVAGATAFLALLFAPLDSLVAAVAAQLTAPLVVIAIMGLAVWRGIHRLRVSAQLAPQAGPR